MTGGRLRGAARRFVRTITEVRARERVDNDRGRIARWRGGREDARDAS